MPFLYLLLELSFNHQLITLSADTVADDVLSGLEFWGRVISGIGLALLLFRIPGFRFFRPIPKAFFCLILGVVLMWNFQKFLTNHLIESASPEDKRASLVLAFLAKDASEGKLYAGNNQPVLKEPGNEYERKIFMALFPAAALHVENRDVQLAQWMGKSAGAKPSEQISASVEKNAYRNLIIPPIAIGFSIFFALLNLAFLVGSIFSLAGAVRFKNWAIALTMSLCLLISFVPTNPLVDSPGYQAVLRDGLWDKKPLLGILVEWSAQSVPAWSPVSSIAHRYFLGNYQFAKPDFLASWL